MSAHTNAHASAGALEAALAANGLPADVEARDRLALIRPRSTTAAQAIAARRGQVIALAATHGFSHAALEIVGTREHGAAAPGDAALPGD